MKKKRAESSSSRLMLTIALTVTFFIAVIIKLGYVQVVRHRYYLAQANSQRKRNITLLAKRGSIYDRNGLKIAATEEKETVSATPYLVKEPLKAARKLAPILKMPTNEIHAKLIKPKGFVYLKKKISASAADKVRKLDIEGIDLFKENMRMYPMGKNASQLIGFVNFEGKGSSGLEMKYDKYLSGKIGRMNDEKDALGRSIPGTNRNYLKPVDGSSLVLTIDREIQHKAQAELAKTIEEFEALSGSIVVMNPQTAEIYAMANNPDFNLNKFNKASKESMKNRAVTDLYEPGSTLKIIPATAAIAESIYEIGSEFSLPPTLNVAGKNIKEAHERGTVNFSLAQIIAESSNVGISKVGLALGKNKLYEYLENFGLLSKTGIDYPGEVSGYTPKPRYWYGPTIATVAFGQGIAVTPLQLARAYSVIANGGKLYKPYVTKEIISSKGRVLKKFRPKFIKRVINKKDAYDAIVMLEKVVSDGTGKAADIKGYTVAGKTGTAQKPMIGAKGYSDDYVSSFVGFAPAEEAKVLVLVVIDSPTKGYYGSQVAAPAFKSTMEFALQKLKISPL